MLLPKLECVTWQTSMFSLIPSVFDLNESEFGCRQKAWRYVELPDAADIFNWTNTPPSDTFTAKHLAESRGAWAKTSKF